MIYLSCDPGYHHVVPFVIVELDVGGFDSRVQPATPQIDGQGHAPLLQGEVQVILTISYGKNICV